MVVAGELLLCRCVRCCCFFFVLDSLSLGRYMLECCCCCCG